MTPSLPQIATLLLASAFASAAHGAGLKLECKDLRPTIKAEAKLIAQKAQGVVSRTKTQLNIKVNGRTIVMKDVVSDDEMEGTYTYFCDRKDGYILLSVFDGSDAGGTVIEESTGKLLQGGVPVVFSEDRQHYLAQTHTSGSDVETWNVYTNGKLRSQGGSALMSKDEMGIVAPLINPVIDAQGRVTAEAQCLNKPEVKWPVALNDKGGKWRWAPVKKCPAD